MLAHPQTAGVVLAALFLLRPYTSHRPAQPCRFADPPKEESGVRSQGSGVRSQGSGVRSQESGVRSQESGVRGVFTPKGLHPKARGRASAPREPEATRDQTLKGLYKPQRLRLSNPFGVAMYGIRVP